jgi:hypothetical protein
MLSWRVIGLGLGIALVAAPGHAASTSPGKSSAFESANLAAMPEFPTPVLTASLAKGKKKTVLAISATITAGGGAPICIGLQATVNGVLPEPSAGAATTAIAVQDCGGCNAQAVPDSLCSTTGTWWLDLDAAELANPGVFINQPISVVLTAGNGGNVVTCPCAGATDVSLSVVVTKK